MRKQFVAVLVILAALLTPTPARADGDPVSGSVTGTVVAAATGKPIVGACVTVFDEQTELTTGCTAADGTYQITGIQDGYNYRLRARAAGYADLWASGKGSSAAADLLYLPGQQDFALRQGSGVLRGRITDRGNPASGAHVYLDLNQPWSSMAITGADGRYTFRDLAPGDYTVNISYQGRSQSAHQNHDDTFTVSNNHTTVVDEAMIPPGSIRFVVTDAITAAPVTDACPGLYEPVIVPARCTNSRGTVQLDEIPAGQYQASLTSTSHWPTDVDSIVVEPGKVTTVPVTLQPAASIVTTVRDSVTNRPIQGVCVEQHETPVRGVADADYTTYCSDKNGQLAIGPIDAGSYQLLAKPVETNYGMQWVGAHGGTGNVADAQIVTATTGTVSHSAPIKMDRPGTIKGTVTDRSTGLPLNHVCAFPNTFDPRLPIQSYANCTQEEGTYTISGLGPYQWRLEYVVYEGDYPWQWSGGASNRLDATPTQVRAGATATAKEAIPPGGGTLTGRGLDPDGHPAHVYVDVFNARSGDYVGWTGTNNAVQTFQLAHLNTQDVKIQINSSCWYDKNATDFTSATPVAITAGHSTDNVNLITCPTNNSTPARTGPAPGKPAPPRR